MTWLMPSTSMPRAAMSVATSVRILPDAERRHGALAVALRLVAVDRLGGNAGLDEAAHDAVGAVLGAGEDEGAVDRLAAEDAGERAGLPALSTRMARWSISSTVVADGVTATVTGSISIWSARRAISGGMVAEKNSVCRSFGTSATIFRMSRMKPMSSMRSASSRTSTSTLSKRTARLLWRSSRRPGVATRTSTPLASARICLPIGTPPMASVVVTRRWRP